MTEAAFIVDKSKLWAGHLQEDAAMTVIARFVWHDGYVDSGRVSTPLLSMWKRIVPQTNIMEWQSGELPVPFERQTATFQLVRFGDGSFEYREVTHGDRGHVHSR